MKEGNKQIRFRFFQAERNTGESWLGWKKLLASLEHSDVKRERKSDTEEQLQEEGKGPGKYKCGIFGIKSRAKWWS